MRRINVLMATMVAIGCGACAPDIQLDEGEGPDDVASIAGMQALFDPSGVSGHKIIPFPNNLLLSPTTGKVSIPAGCGPEAGSSESASSAGLRAGVLNTLDGFGTFKPVIRIPVASEPDTATLQDKVKLYQRAAGGVAVSTATEVPLMVVASQVMVAGAGVDNSDGTVDCTNALAETPIWHIIAVPLIPLSASSTYTVGLLTGGSDTAGNLYTVTSTFGFIRQTENPVTLTADGKDIASHATALDPFNDPADKAQLMGLDLLWKVHARGIGYLASTGIERADLLMAFDFNTTTTYAPLDPSVAGSPAASIEAKGLTGPAIPSTDPVQYMPSPLSLNDVAQPVPLSAAEYIVGALMKGQGLSQAVAQGTCAAIGCAAVEDVYEAHISTTNYQLNVPGPTGLVTAWSDPFAPEAKGTNELTVRIFRPVGDMPDNGYPVVVFGHGLGGSKDNTFVIAPQLAAQGFATIAISWVAHNDRAIQIDTSAAKACDGERNTSDDPQCFAQILTPDLASTRDNIRQSVLDALTLIENIKGCTAAAPCGDLAFDSSKIGYLGQSLGGLIGSVLVGVSPDIEASVINVGGSGWIDVIDQNSTPEIVCPLVDGLIFSGILEGDYSAAGPTALCLKSDWNQQAGWKTFAAVGRWILDPADSANSAELAKGKKILIQKVVGDTVVPNIAQDQFAKLLGVTGAAAESTTFTNRESVDGPTAAIFDPTNTNPVRFVRYDMKTCQDACDRVAAANVALPALSCVLDGAGTGFECLLPATDCSSCTATESCVDIALPPTGTTECRMALETPVNTYQHASLLRPDAGDESDGAILAGKGGTAQMQTDAIGFLHAHIIGNK